MASCYRKIGFKPCPCKTAFGYNSRELNSKCSIKVELERRWSSKVSDDDTKYWMVKTQKNIARQIKKVTNPEKLRLLSVMGYCRQVGGAANSWID